MLADVHLIREYRPHVTLGTMVLPDGTTIKTLEPPWLNNRSNVSCIPAGTYNCEWLQRSASGKYKRCWHVTGVPGRVGILIHAGNRLAHTLGCILPGKKHGYLGGQDAVLSSKSALNMLRKQLEGKPFVLSVEY
jgi:hypothetical protein